MPSKRIEEISKELQNKRGLSEEVAIIERGTYPDQKVYVTRLGELHKFTNLTSPSMLVLGKVVKLREYLRKIS